MTNKAVVPDWCRADPTMVDTSKSQREQGLPEWQRADPNLLPFAMAAKKKTRASRGNQFAWESDVSAIS